MTKTRFHWTSWHTGLTILTVASATVYLWALELASRSEYYASIAYSMSMSFSNFFFGALDPAGTGSLDKIPGSYWVPAAFVKIFGFSTWSIEAPNAIATVVAVILIAIATKRLAGPTAGLIAGAAFAATPIVAAVARSNQPQSFFLLTLALAFFSGVNAIQKKSLGHLVLAGVWVGLAFQMYMLEAWAVWPALIVAYLLVDKKLILKLRDLAIAGLTSLVVSLSWIFVVSLVPASERPYVGGTYSNSAWEMVFGYNGLGRFSATGSSTGAYRSFTPPFSGSPSVLRLVNEQLAGQIAWLIPTAILGIVLLFLLKFSKPVIWLLTVWFATFAVMFSVVAGMHQFYTSALALPMAVILGVAFAEARKQNKSWMQLALIGLTVTVSIAISLTYSSYLPWLAWVQLVIGILAAVAVIVSEETKLTHTWWVALLAGASMLLTPLVWTIDTINHSNAINPVAGSSSGMGGGAGGPGGMPTNRGPMPVGQGQQGPAGGTPGMGGSASSALISYLQTNRGVADYLVATAGAQSAASIITATGESVLPIGGFDGSDPYPTLDAFKQLVADGKLRFVLGGGQGGMGGPGGMPGGPGQQTGTTNALANNSSAISEWVAASCTLVTDSSVSSNNLYDCSAAK
jgi:4-amino-4-deoxy-L-arabinose transferase-like glycosyltransferase